MRTLQALCGFWAGINNEAEYYVAVDTALAGIRLQAEVPQRSAQCSVR